MSKRRVYLIQCNNRYGDNVYLPYSVGLCWAYAATFPIVQEHYELAGFVYIKEDVRLAALKLRDPDLVAIACYIWNWQWSLAFASEVKRRWPKCMVLVGGVQVQDESSIVLKEHSQLDFAIYGEGEGAFKDLLCALAAGPDFDPYTVGSLVWRYDQNIVVNPRRAFVDLNELRSPYLDGTFDSILNDGWKWQTAQETNRGCPVAACTFCAWGSATQNKLRQLPLDRILAELDWFSAHESTYIENCDANFGILPRDEDIVDRMIALKESTGYPQRFRAAWLKNSNETVFRLASKLHAADMLKSVTLSMQSMDDGVLTLIKRKNIKYDKFEALLDRYNAAGIPTYTELIMGLPGETYESHINGIDQLLDAGQHDGLFIYPCVILPNTEMAQESYLRTHGIGTAPTRAMLLHATPEDNIDEIQDLVVHTRTMPFADWCRVYMYSWAIQCFHCLGLTQHLAIDLCGGDYSYSEFYERLVFFAQSRAGTMLGQEWHRTHQLLFAALHGAPWTLVDPRFGDITWPPEEFSYLQLVSQPAQLRAELLEAFPEHKDAVLAQADLWPVLDYADRVRWARENVWYGRKGSGAKARIKTAVR
jgi:putative methyltransferase